MIAAKDIFYRKKREPHLRIAITPKCNFNCIYCKPGGEGCDENGILMTADEIVKVIEIASQVGFRHVKFTGGEPLLRDDLVEIIRRSRQISGIKELQLVTNGYLLTKNYAISLKDAGLDNITVSLDASSYDMFERITLVNKEKFDNVLNGIFNARKVGFPVTINTVLMKLNEGELEGLIDIAYQTGAKLKLIDFMDLGNRRLWRKEYLQFDHIRKKLRENSKKIGWSFPPGGLGTPMPTYTLKNGVEVLVRDATVGTNYHRICEECENYPCQDALISLRITHDGKLKRCLIRDDNLISILTDLRQRDYSAVRKAIQESYKILVQAKFYPNAWRPKNNGEVNKNEKI